MFHRDKRGKFRCSETCKYKMTDHFGQFNDEAYAAFQEAATEKYDFGACQRSDGSIYGIGAGKKCRQGAPTESPSKEKAAKSGDGGAARKAAKASGEVSDRKAAARKENEAKKAASPRTDSKMSSKRAAEVKAKFDAQRKAAGGSAAPTAKAVRALDKKAKAAEKKAEAADQKWRKGGMKDKALQKEVRRLDKEAKAAEKAAEKADKAWRKASGIK